MLRNLTMKINLLTRSLAIATRITYLAVLCGCLLILPGFFSAAHAALTLNTTVNGETANTLAEAVIVNAGDTITLAYTIQNTGNTPVVQLDLSDNVFDPIVDLSESCGLVDSLQPHQSISCTLEVTAVEATDGMEIISLVTAADEFFTSTTFNTTDSAWFKTSFLVGNPDLCFAISDGYFQTDGTEVNNGNAEDTLGFFNRATGNTNTVTAEPPNTGTFFIEAMAFQPGGTALYATDGDTLGTVDLLTGAFTAIGDASDSNPSVTDIDGLSFDPTTGKLWGTERNSGTTADQLLELDPGTGAILTGPTNVPPQQGLGDLDDLAIDPVWGTFYVIQNQVGGPGNLAIIDPSSGNTFTVGKFTRRGIGEQISDIAGLAFFNDGQLYGSSGKNSANGQNVLWRIDKTTAVVELVGEFASRMSNIEALDCLTAPSFLAIEKSTNGADADEAPGALIPIGNNVVWSYFVRNTGGQLITNIVVTDDNGTPGNPADDNTVCTIPQLSPGQSNLGVGVTCELQGTATDGQYTNIVTATGLSIGETLTRQDPSNYFGYNPGAIGDYVWIDINKNGIQEASEPALPNVEVKLHNANDDALLGTTTTDAAGFYLFDNLAAGDYYLIFDLSQNTNFTTFTTQNAGGNSNDAADSDVNSSGRTPNINLSTGGKDRSWDAGVDGGDATALSITSSATASVQENQTSAIDVQSTDDLDSEGSGLTYSLTGGADRALFTIDASTGVVTFDSAPDFEVPGDANADNDYEFQVTVTDSTTLTDMQNVVVSVVDVAEDLTVNTTNDLIDATDGVTSLREAINSANTVAGEDTITFDASVFNGEVDDVIRLQGGQLAITESLHINGAGQNIVISADQNGDDVLVNGSAITDIVASNAAAKLGDNTGRVLDITAPTGSTVTLTGLTITGADMDGFGGGIKNNTGKLVINQSSVSGNRATLGAAGVDTGAGPLMLTESTVSGNVVTAAVNGGGLRSDTGTITITNSTISGNTTVGPFGGGVFANTATVLVDSSTIVANASAANGGGVVTFGPTTFTNSIIVGNSVNTGPAPDMAGTGSNFTGSFNLLGTGDPVAGTDNQTRLTFASAMLGQLTNNGGLTQTHALLPGSPAIDSGSTMQTTDQRAQSRPIDQNAIDSSAGGNSSDIGAFELAQAAVLDAVSQIGPTEGGTTNTLPTFSWTAVVNATRYRLLVIGPAGSVIDQTFTAAELGCDTGGTCSFPTSAAIGPGNLSWQVRALSDTGIGPLSNPMNFIAAATCDANVLSRQIDNVNRWHLLSLPCDLPPSTTLGDLFVGGAPAADRWLAFRYDVAGASGNYQRLMSTDTVPAGIGFWLLTMDAVTLQMPANSTQPAQAPANGSAYYTHSIAADSTWNMFGSPGPDFIQYSDILLQNEQTNCAVNVFCTLDNALANENIASLLFSYNTNLNNGAGQYQRINNTGTRLIKPWDGYWVRIAQNPEGTAVNSPWQLFYPASSGQLLFATDTQHTGDLAGISGADQICNTAARAHGLPGNYKAWLSDSSNSPESGFSKPSTPYFRVDGAQLANDYTALTSGNLSSPIQLTVSGLDVSVDQAWTGTLSTGLPDAANGHCSDWASTSLATSGAVGNIADIEASWSSTGTAPNCSQLKHLYCVGQ